MLPVLGLQFGPSHSAAVSAQLSPGQLSGSQSGVLTAQSMLSLPYLMSSSYSFDPSPSMRTAPKLPLATLVASYFMVMRSPLPAASTTACGTAQGTTCPPPPYDDFVAAARPLTLALSMPTIGANENSCDSSICTVTFGMLPALRPLNETVIVAGSMPLCVAHSSAAAIAADSFGNSCAAAMAIASAAFCNVRRSEA